MYILIDDSKLHVYLNKKLQFASINFPIFNAMTSSLCLPALLTNNSDKIACFCENVQHVNMASGNTADYIGRLVYDSSQINQFSHDKMWKCIDSITMNRYDLNISIHSSKLLSTYEPTQSTHKNNWNFSFKSMNRLNKYFDLFRKTLDFVDLFGIF